jgi:hypothetical protein
MFKGEVRSPVTVLILTLVTCGLYGLVWFFKIAEELNEAFGEKRFPPGKELALSIVTCGLWGLWLYWRLSEAAVELQKERGLSPKLESWMLFASAFVGFFPFFMQAMLNEVWTRGGRLDIGGGGSGGRDNSADDDPEPEPSDMAGDFVERFKAMVDELKEHPRVAVTHYWVGEPVSEEDIAEVEEALGFELDAQIKDFYRQADGLQVRWMDRLGESYVADRDDEMSTERGTYICGDNDDAMGVIDILPLREVFLTDQEGMLYHDWMEDSDTEFRGESLNLMEFSKAIHPFENFSFYNSAAFYAGDEEPGITVVVGDDHNATFTSSRITDFASYLEFSLAHRGQPEPRRETLVQWGGDKKPRLVFTAEEYGRNVIPLEQMLPDRSYLLTDEDLASDEPVRATVTCGSVTGATRATVIDVVDAPTAPTYWRRGTDFVKVDFDLTGIGFVARKSLAVLRRTDIYEEARQDVAAFFSQLAEAPSDEQAETLAKICPAGPSSTMYNIEREGDGEPMKVVFDAHTHRYVALLNELDTEEAMKLILPIIEGLVIDGLDNSVTVKDDDQRAYDPSAFKAAQSVTYAKVVRPLWAAVATWLIEDFNAEPYENIAARYGDDVAAQIKRIVEALDGVTVNMSDFPLLDFFTAALEKFPGSVELQVRRIGSGYTSDKFGLDEEELPVLSS